MNGPPAHDWRQSNPPPRRSMRLPVSASLHDRVALGAARLAAAGIGPTEARLDARVLAQHVLGWDAAVFFTHGPDPPPPGFAESYDPLIERRAGREPLAYLVGRQEFWGLSFEVSPAVLIPRPETELLVEASLEAFPDSHHPIRIADACTGSGCVAVALAHERPTARVVATDISAEALVLARRNARRHGVASRVAFVRADLLEGVEARFDLIVSNPPYILEDALPTLQPEVRDHEPSRALLAGADGLSLIRRLVAGAPHRLQPGGRLIFELGAEQDGAVLGLIRGTPGLTMVSLRRDLQALPRAAVVERT